MAADVSPRAASSRQAVCRAVRRGVDRVWEKRWEVDMRRSRGRKSYRRQSVSLTGRPYDGGNAGGLADPDLCNEAFRLGDAPTRGLCADAYARTRALYYQHQPSLDEILKRLEPWQALRRRGRDRRSALQVRASYTEIDGVAL